MGNYNTRTVKFRQSVTDFPLTVSLGRENPVFGLNRWGNHGLVFKPPDDEGFSLRGDKRRLLYKGRRRSHRFTILGDGAFEYDCILNKEPETNVITLFLEGAEQYDFFRQPDFVPDPFLKGSYAVYKKETLLGEGTGKLCHIHRPLIIDARGRRVWGDLSVVGNCLCITIPEQWLAEAKYPVIVDPTVGTTTIGSQITGADPNNPGYDRPWLDNEYIMNKYLVPQNGSGLCTAYVYCYNDDTESYATPFLYNNVNNKPYMKKSQNEKEIEVWVWPPSRPVGWKNNTFNINGSIAAGEYVWFGIHSGWFTTRFDYGGECYKGWFNYDLFPDYDGEPPPYMNITQWDTFCTLKFSMYFNYTAVTTQNYMRTITQGVTLTDSRTLTGEYKRSTAQTVNGITINNTFYSFLRSIFETQIVTDTVKRCGDYCRGLYVEVENIADAIRQGEFYRNADDTVQAVGTVFRGLLIFVRLLTTSLVRDFILRRFLIAREELVLKSCITRELTLESKIN